MIKKKKIEVNWDIKEEKKRAKKIKEETKEILVDQKWHKNRTYNWPVLKLQYFESDYMEVETYLREIHGINLPWWHWARKCKGWHKEKKARQERILESLMAENEIRIKEKWRKVFEKIEDAHIEWLWALADQVFAIAKWNQKNTFELINILKHFRLEKGQATDLTKDLTEKKWAKEFLEEMEKEENQK